MSNANYPQEMLQRCEGIRFGRRCGWPVRTTSMSPRCEKCAAKEEQAR